MIKFYIVCKNLNQRNKKLKVLLMDKCMKKKERENVSNTLNLKKI